MHDKFVNSEKLLVVFQSAKKLAVNIKKKKKEITFVGKLNKSKGYDIFGNAVLKILNKYKDWKANVVGDEQRDKIDFKHKNLKNYGFLSHKKVLEIYKRSSSDSAPAVPDGNVTYTFATLPNLGGKDNALIA